MRRVVKLELQPNHREGAVARRIASAVLQDDHANAKEVADVELATSELVTNAVEASTGSEALSISIELSDDDVRVSVTNQGEEFEPTLSKSKADDIRGRGLAIVRAIGDLTIEHDDGATTVSAEIPLSPKQ
jgi:anti-sigma regulatory factor (Ser/Thr protein kinase)